MVQQAAFAIGVPYDIYAFHRYIINSTYLNQTQVYQYQWQFYSWAAGFHHWLNKPPTHSLNPINPDNAWTLRITAAAGTELAGASFEGTVKFQAYLKWNPSSLPTEVYDPRAFILHAALLGQAFAHCPKFPTAASRRSLGRVSVPVWLIILSDQLSIVALVSLYLTNKLMERGLILWR